MVKYRDHRSTLADSMETVREINDLDELRTHLETTYEPMIVGEITVKPYAFDARIGWDTHVVCIDGNAVGFTDGPISNKTSHAFD